MSNSTTIGWDDPQIPIAIGIALGAGLSTGIGGALVFFPQLLKKVPQAIILAVALALSAGVMIYVSFIEIFVKSLGAIQEALAETAEEGDNVEGTATLITTVMFFAGMGFCALLELVVHKIMGHEEVEVPAAGTEMTTSTEGATEEVKVEVAGEGDLIGNKAEAPKLARMGMMTALAIGIHNIPEGLATFMATIEDTGLGASLGVAIAIHNIPEGLCVAMPIFYASGSKCKAFTWALMSGVAEVIGGIVGFAILQPVFTPVVFGIVFAMVGGMMVFIVCHELLPAAHKYMANGAKTTMWLIIGMVIMAVSLVLFVI